MTYNSKIQFPENEEQISHFFLFVKIYPTILWVWDGEDDAMVSSYDLATLL